MADIPEKRDLEKNLLAALSGVMLTASFPPVDLFWIPWVALFPLFMALERAVPGDAVKLGLLTGLTHYLTLIYWIVPVLNHYGNLSLFMSIGPFLLLCLYLSIFIALFSWAYAKAIHGLRFRWFHAAGFWVATEYIRAHLLTGFPWCLLGYSQHSNIDLIQISDITGVYGLSFLIVLANGILYGVVFKPHIKKKKILWTETALGALLLIVSILYGIPRVGDGNGEKSTHFLSYAVIQPNIDQSIKWDPTYQHRTMDTLERLTRSTFSSKPEMIIWPETALPFYYQNTFELSKRVSDLQRKSRADLLFGSPAYKRKGKQFISYNRAYLLDTKGGTQYYDKVHLVPFGEYVPLKRFLFFAERLVEGAGDFEPGNNIKPFETKKFLVGPLICFEAIFPSLARLEAKQGAQIFVNLTNDAWFGTTSAPYQHLAMAVFRAVENHRPLIRAANTGFSALVSSRGEILSISRLFNEETLVGDIRFGSHGLTFYSRFGDTFALISCGVSLWVLLWFFLYGKKHRVKKIGKKRQQVR